MMNQSISDHSQVLPRQAPNYIPPSVPPNIMQYQQQSHNQALPPVQHSQTGEIPANYYQPSISNSNELDNSSANSNSQKQSHVQQQPHNQSQQNQYPNQQQQQMNQMMQMQQPWMGAGAGFGAAPYMMPYPMGPMMMMNPQQGIDRPASRQSTRPPSRQSTTGAMSSSRSVNNGHSGNSSQLSAQSGFPNLSYSNYFPPGMYHPWFDPYWQAMYTGYQNPYNMGYLEEKLRYGGNAGQVEDDRNSQRSGAPSQSNRSAKSASMHSWGSIDSLNGDF